MGFGKQVKERRLQTTLQFGLFAYVRDNGSFTVPTRANQYYASCAFYFPRTMLLMVHTFDDDDGLEFSFF